MSFHPVEDALSDFLYRKFGMHNSSGWLNRVKRGREYSTGFVAFDVSGDPCATIIATKLRSTDVS